MLFKIIPRFLLFLVLMLLASVCAFAQLSDLDLLESNDRSVSASVLAMPDPVSGEHTESRSAIVLLPLAYGKGNLTFQGGAGGYFSQSVSKGELSSYLQWRVQGGPHWKWLGLQFYVEGFWQDSVSYAGFFRLGEFDLGHVLLSGGFGTLVEAETETNLAVGIERDAPAGADQVVKGLFLLSGEVDTSIFESLRLLGTYLPSSEGHDVIGEIQVAYELGRINLVALGRFGVEEGEFTRRYTGLVQVPF